MGLVENALLTFKHQGVKSFVRKSLRFVLQLIYLPICRIKVKGFKTDDLDKLIDFASTIGFQLINPDSR